MYLVYLLETSLIISNLQFITEAAGEVNRDVEKTRVSRDGLVSNSGWKDAFECGGISGSLEKDSSQSGQESHSSVLPPPTDLQMEHISLAAVLLHWSYENMTTHINMSTVSVQFLVQCDRDGIGFATASDLLNVTMYTFDLLCQTTAYQFRVLAYSDGVYSIPSIPTYSFVNGVTAPAGPPTDVEVHVQSPYSVLLTWDPPSPPPLGDVVYYIHWGKEDPDNLDKREVVWRSTVYTLDSLLPAHTYYLYLVADVSSHLSSPSRLLNVTTPADLPAVVIISQSFSASSTWIYFNWSAPPNNRYPIIVDGFTVLYAEAILVPSPDIGNCSFYSSLVLSNDSFNANVTSLVPGTEYVFRVFYCSKGTYISDWSDAEGFRTNDSLVCGVCEPVNSSSLRIMWETSLTRGHVIEMVSILQKTSSGKREIGTTLSSASSDLYVIGGLHPWTEYEFTVAMGNSSSPTHLVSDCPVDSCITSEDAPSQPPLNFEATASTSTTVTLEWDIPPLSAQNGIVTHYFLAYACTTPTSWRNCNTTVPRIVPANDRHGNVKVYNLTPYTEYWFQIAAETCAGRGPSTSVLSNTTQDIPSQPPRRIIVQNITATSASLVWSPPEPWNQNGPIISYSVAYSIRTRPTSDSQNLKSNSSTESHGDFKIVVSFPRVDLCHLSPETEYDVSISAMTEIGKGPYSLPLTFQTNRSDIFVMLEGMQCNVETESTSGKRNCSTLTVNWNKTLSELLLLYDNSTISANFTVIVSDTCKKECWKANLSAAATSYHIPDQLVRDCGRTFLLQLQIEILLQNGSHLHLSSPLLNLSTSHCDRSGNKSAIVWRIAIGVILAGVSVVTFTACPILCIFIFRWCKRKHYASSSTAILMDTYQAEGGLDEETQMSSTLRVGDGAVIERVSEALADNPTPYSHFEMSVSVNSTEGDDDSVDEEDMPLLGSDEKATESTPSDLLLQCSLSSTPLRRPTELPLPFSLFRSSPEGQSLSSLSTSPSPVSSADSHQVTPPNSPSHLS